MVVLVAGESLVDVVTSADGTSTGHPGGSPANVAVALARLGTRVRLLTAYGDDARGALLDGYLDEPGLEPAADPRVLDRTSSAVATLDPAGAASYEFDISGVLPEPELTETPAHLHVGSIGAVLAPGADLLARLVRELSPLATVSYDVNARPSAVPLDDRVRARVATLVAASDVVKVSDEDLGVWAPGQPVDEAAAGLVALGAGCVVVTMGAHGARCHTSAGLVAEVPAADVAVRDTIGAGDVFCATLLDTLRRRELLGGDRRAALRGLGPGEWRSVLERANRAAAFTVARAGAVAPTAADVDG